MKKKRMKTILLWVIVSVWALFIFMFSAQNGDLSIDTSSEIIRNFLEKIMPDFNEKTSLQQKELISSLQFWFRKGAHALNYAAFSMLIMGALYYLNIKIKWVYSLGICLIFAISDEIHQGFVPGRTPHVRDVVIDFCGAIVGIAIFKGITYLIRNKKIVENSSK